jgi:uncharacterized membrane protein YhaH (DUF805 family)
MDWYLMAWQKYAQFSGRSRRKEYWMFTLIHTALYIVLWGSAILAKPSWLSLPLALICLLYALAAVVPGIACTVRRLHDTGRSGWWILLSFVPLIGLAVVVLLALDSEPGPNQYGPSPKLGAPPFAAG